jgi:hypothetical protein
MEKLDVQAGPLTMPDKNPAADCWDGPGARHENGKHARRDPEIEDGREIERRAARDANRQDAPPKAPDK